ncbi:MAG: SpoVA/SpoVAEb family sporulation membrane protein [Lachnospiraceae bacterium]|nr:SpoVA/SpoVAEb family sporulation membrane protein [Lachnospiraceae bacterium]
MNEQKSSQQISLEKDYEEYVKKITPTHNLLLQMLKAFITGGIICVLGQFLLNYAKNSLGMDKDTAGSFCSLVLVLTSVLLTGFNLYSPIVKFGGAGALVPITGFANSVASPAIEYKKEGQVFGVGCKIFTIAGPVILYGIFTSWVLGLVYWIGKASGIL